MSKSRYFKSIRRPQYGNIFKAGNLKLPSSTIIFNLQPAHMCISRTIGLCQLNNPNKCYAYRDEKRYKNIRAYRERQFKYWNTEPLNVIIHDLIDLIKAHNIKAIRFNESGDIRHIRDLERINIIAMALLDYNVRVYMYTARSDLKRLIDNGTYAFNQSKNLVINGSGFMWDNNFKVLEPTDKPVLRCMGNCRTCSLCLNKHDKVIHVPLH